jgi:hypothetical protein
MPITLTLRKEQLADLKVIRDLGPELLQSVIDKLSNVKLLPIRASELYLAITEALPERKREANAIMSLLMWLYPVRRQRDLSVEDIMEGLQHGINAQKEKWEKSEEAAWTAIQPQLQKLLSLQSVLTLIKGLELIYDHQNLLQNMKILTDVRPIYNEDASDISGAIVSYTLRLDYNTIGHNKTISLAMDKDDVRKLRNMCDRALKKSETAKKFMLAHDVERTLICGEER